MWTIWTIDSPDPPTIVEIFLELANELSPTEYIIYDSK